MHTLLFLICLVFLLLEISFAQMQAVLLAGGILGPILMRFNESRVFDNHGRGIAIASTSLHVRYLGSGNKVLVSIPTQKDKYDTS